MAFVTLLSMSDWGHITNPDAWSEAVIHSLYSEDPRKHLICKAIGEQTASALTMEIIDTNGDKLLDGDFISLKEDAPIFRTELSNQSRGTHFFRNG